MHELSLCQAIAGKVTERAEGRPVTEVVIRVGHFRQVVPDAMEFCWSMLTESSGLSGCKLTIEQIPATVECSECGAETTLDVPILTCESCGSTNVKLMTGEELMVVSLQIAEV
ncbi:MAG: hydrogenase maturation nickel metallochaperone HypA [Actinomycetota bacterium]|nr:hydrogenase maturation nickel metallochaperone HypA [Actinomycetota bacterium]